MLVFGLAGVVLAGVMAAALIGGAIAARNVDDRLGEDQAKIAASLTRLTATMESLALTTDHAGTTLATSSATLADARDVLQSASDTAVSLAAALDLDLLGRRPFATASEQVTALGRALATFRDRAEALAVTLDRNATDATEMARQIRLMKDQANELAGQVAGFDRIGEIVALVLGGIVLAALLTAWVAVAAGFCAWVGWRLRRIGAADRSRADGSAAAEAPSGRA